MKNVELSVTSVCYGMFGRVRVSCVLLFAGYEEKPQCSNQISHVPCSTNRHRRHAYLREPGWPVPTHVANTAPDGGVAHGTEEHPY